VHAPSIALWINGEYGVTDVDYQFDFFSSFEPGPFQQDAIADCSNAGLGRIKSLQIVITTAEIKSYSHLGPCRLHATLPATARIDRPFFFCEQASFAGQTRVPPLPSAIMLPDNDRHGTRARTV
jgi:hypothetical protein